MAWHRVAVETDRSAVELISDLLWGWGTAGIEERVAADGNDVLLIAGFSSRSDADAAAEHLAPLVPGEVRIEAITDDGLDAWRRWARPMRAGRFAITPPWCDPLTDGSETLWIDPGRTFGSGSHPTTRLVLELAAGLVRPGDRVLDVGAGSGVLAVAAARCGAAAVTAIDIDPASPEATTANAMANDVASTVHASTTALRDLAAAVEAGAPPYDLVLGNLLAPTIVELAALLIKVTRPGGHLVVSGLLLNQRGTVMGALDAASKASEGPDGSVVEVRDDDGWVAVAFRRNAAR